MKNCLLILATIFSLIGFSTSALANLEYQSTYNIYDTAKGIVLDVEPINETTIAVIYEHYGVLFLDISEPSMPEELGRFDTNYLERQISYNGEYLLVGCSSWSNYHGEDENSGKIVILDVSNPSSPFVVSEILNINPNYKLEAKGNYVVSMHYAYWDYSDGYWWEEYFAINMWIHDISDITSPTIVDQCDSGGDEWGYEDFPIIFSQNHLLVKLRNGQFTHELNCYDLNNNYAFVGSLDEMDLRDVESICADEYLYLLKNTDDPFHDDMVVVDPANLEVVSTIELENVKSYSDISIVDTTMTLVTGENPMSWIYTFSIAEGQDTPQLLLTDQFQNGGTVGGYTISGNTLLEITYSTMKLHDISDPSNVEFRYETNPHLEENLSSIANDETHIYFSDGSDFVKIVDIGDSANPVLVDSSSIDGNPVLELASYGNVLYAVTSSGIHQFENSGNQLSSIKHYACSDSIDQIELIEPELLSYKIPINNYNSEVFVVDYGHEEVEFVSAPLETGSSKYYDLKDWTIYGVTRHEDDYSQQLSGYIVRFNPLRLVTLDDVLLEMDNDEFLYETVRNSHGIFGDLLLSINSTTPWEGENYPTASAYDLTTGSEVSTLQNIHYPRSGWGSLSVTTRGNRIYINNLYGRLEFHTGSSTTGVAHRGSHPIEYMSNRGRKNRLLEFEDHVIIPTVTGFNIFYSELIDMDYILDVDEDPDLTSTIPEEFELSDAYPNPFNSSVNIPFALPSESHVKITIYDILGRQTAVLVDQNISAGKHSVHWNGRSMNDITSPSGIYFLRMVAGSFTQTQKIILLK
jgi:hypothetical protein